MLKTSPLKTYIINPDNKTKLSCNISQKGDMVASWLVRSTLDRVVWV